MLFFWWTVELIVDIFQGLTKKMNIEFAPHVTVDGSTLMLSFYSSFVITSLSVFQHLAHTPSPLVLWSLTLPIFRHLIDFMSLTALETGDGWIFLFREEEDKISKMSHSHFPLWLCPLGSLEGYIYADKNKRRGPHATSDMKMLCPVDGALFPVTGCSSELVFTLDSGKLTVDVSDYGCPVGIRG